MPNGKHSRTSRDLANVRLQLKSGTTRSQNPRALRPEEIAALESKKRALENQLRESADARFAHRNQMRNPLNENADANDIVKAAEATHTATNDLYLMRYSTCEDTVKIGGAANVYALRGSLELGLW